MLRPGQFFSHSSPSFKSREAGLNGQPQAMAQGAANHVQGPWTLSWLHSAVSVSRLLPWAIVCQPMSAATREKGHQTSRVGPPWGSFGELSLRGVDGAE